MEVFIKEGSLLLTYYEWCCGEKPKEKVIKAREKLVKKGQAEIAKRPEDAKTTDNGNYKIHRKGKL